MKRPFVITGCSMFISSFIFSYLGIPAAAVLFVITAIVSLPTFILRNKNKKWKTVLYISLAVLTSSLLFSAKTVYEYLPAISLCDDRTHTVSGTLIEYEPAYGNHYYTLDNVYIDEQLTNQKIRINSSIYKNAQTDDILTFTNATIYELGSTREISLNYKADGIYIGAYTGENFTVQKAFEHSVSYYLQSVRNFITDKLNENMYPEYAAVTNALLTGDKTAIDYDTQLNFRYSGISHLFAVSGFHLALWTSLLSAALSKILKKHKIISDIISIIFVIFFMALTGFTKSVIRSGIMLIIMLFGRIIKFKADSLNSLFIALTLIILTNPFSATSLSLQMSFLATLGIITLSAPLTEPLRSLKTKIKSKLIYKVISAFYSTVAISVVATLFTIPVSSANFGYYSPAAPVSNLLCMTVSQILMPIAGFATVLSPLPFVAKPMFTLCNFLVKYLIAVTSAIGHNTYAVTRTDAPITRTIVLLILFITAVFLLIFTGKNKRLRRCISLSAAAIFLLSAGAELSKANSYEITVADVGNGMSIVLSTGKSDVIIGCGGGKYSDYKFTNCADKVNQREFDLLLIPRNTSTESQYAFDIAGTYHFDSCIISNEDFPSDIMRRLPENTTKQSNATVELDENTTLIYINNDSFTGARIESPDFSATILFRATSDFSAVEEDWLCGDLLVTRQNLPNVNISGFEKIIVSTSSKTTYENGNIYSTEISGSLKYSKSPWGGSSVNAV